MFGDLTAALAEIARLERDQWPPMQDGTGAIVVNYGWYDLQYKSIVSVTVLMELFSYGDMMSSVNVGVVGWKHKSTQSDIMFWMLALLLGLQIAREIFETLPSCCCLFAATSIDFN